MLKKLVKNNGYCWFHGPSISAKGYLTDPYGRFYSDFNLLEYFKDIRSEDEFKLKLKQANGCFTVIFHKIGHYLIGVDPLSAFPIFYSCSGNTPSVSDDPTEIIKHNPNASLDITSSNQFISAGFVSGSKTLVNSINRVNAGCFIRISTSGEVVEVPYYSLPFQNVNVSKAKGISLLYDSMVLTIERLILAANNRPIVIPLSGGYDSRMLLTLLHKYKYKNIISYSYGSPNSHEVKRASNVANTLGIPWHFIDYSSIDWKPFFQQPLNKYFLSSHTFSSLPHFGDLMAVHIIKKKLLVPDSSIFCPGHSGDMLGGSHIPEALYNSTRSVDKSFIVDAIIKDHFSYQNDLDQDVITSIKEELMKQLPSKTKFSIPESVHAFETWDIQNRQSKYIVNSCRIYEEHGYQWYLPLWDLNLVQTCYEMPISFRYGSNLYEECLFKYLFIPYSVDQKRYTPITSSFPIRVLRTLLTQRMYETLRWSSKSFFRSQSDYNCMQSMMDYIIPKLPNPVTSHNRNEHHVVARWLISQIDASLSSGQTTE